MHLKRNRTLSRAIVALLLLVSGFSYASVAQIISVKEVRPGHVTATVGIFTAKPPKPWDFWLQFEKAGVIRSQGVKPAHPVLPPGSVVFCIDQDSSMDRAVTQQIREALRDVVLNAAQPLNTALLVFDSEITKLRELTRNGPELAAAINEIGAASRADGKTKMYEAVAMSLSELANRHPDGPARLILISAGKDNGSSITEQVVAEEANAQNIKIDTIAFGNVSDTGYKALARLAKDTSGRFIFLGHTQQLAPELHKLLEAPSQVVDVLFEYEVVEETGGEKVSAQLVFAPDDQIAALLPIRHRLSAPEPAPLGVGLPNHPASKQEVDSMIFQWIIFGGAGYLAYLALFILYVMRGKLTKPTPGDRSADHKDTDWRKP